MYLIFALIDCLASSPVAGAEDSDDVAAVREADSHHAPSDSTETIVAFLDGAVRQVFCNDTSWVDEGQLCRCEGDSMLPPILLVFPEIPVESG